MIKTLSRIKPIEIVFVIVISFFAWLLAKNAWYGDDAFITMRVIDNFIHGYGLVWNVGERVQVFTHPLWLFVLTPLYAILQDPYQTIYWLSFVVTLVTIFLLFSHFSKTYRSALAASLLLAASTSYIDYSSSGLENPLTHLLLIILLIIVLKYPVSERTNFYTSLIAALAAVNRLDSILFYIPIIGYQVYELRTIWFKALAQVIIGFLPLLVWESFALFYYGFPFPNTYYSKLAIVNLSENWFHNQAWEYFKNSFSWDPITLVTITLSMIFVLWEHKINKISILIGMAFYLYYIFSIGGDFMSGRFFSPLFLISTTLLMTFNYGSLFGKVGVSKYLCVMGIIVFLGLSARNPPVLINNNDKDQNYGLIGIANEKLFYFNSTSWYTRNRFNTIHEWGIEGLDFKRLGGHTVVRNTIGLFGYYAGPGVYILDNYAITDPLRSRLNVVGPIRIGHFRRPIPSGYEDTVKDNFNNQLVNPDLRLYYDKLSILIHDDIFTSGRFQEIINMNLGLYDHLIKRYNESAD